MKFFSPTYTIMLVTNKRTIVIEISLIRILIFILFFVFFISWGISSFSSLVESSNLRKESLGKESLGNENNIIRKFSNDGFNYKWYDFCNRDVPMILPCQGEITSGVGWRINPVLGGLEYHNGLDIANKRGSYIYAPANGEVIWAG